MTQKKSSSAEKDNLSTKCVNKVLNAKQEKQLYMQGAPIDEISRQMQLDRRTVKKYVEGTPEDVCSHHRIIQREVETSLSNYRNSIIGELAARK